MRRTEFTETRASAGAGRAWVSGSLCSALPEARDVRIAREGVDSVIGTKYDARQPPSTLMARRRRRHACDADRPASAAVIPCWPPAQSAVFQHGYRATGRTGRRTAGDCRCLPRGSAPLRAGQPLLAPAHHAVVGVHRVLCIHRGLGVQLRHLRRGAGQGRQAVAGCGLAPLASSTARRPVTRGLDPTPHSAAHARTCCMCSARSAFAAASGRANCTCAKRLLGCLRHCTSLPNLG